MLILGADPGSIHTGYGLVESDGRRHVLVDTGVFTPPPRSDLGERLLFLHASMSALIGRARPALMAVEDVFHAANSRSALVLGHVRGVLILAGMQAGLELRTFAPATVKAQITGYGRADKAQVAFMVGRLLGLGSDVSAASDATDALAVALCAAHSAQLVGPRS